MTPYITLNGISSIALGLRLVKTEPFIIPRRNRRREYIPGRIGSLASADFELPVMGYKIQLSAAGLDKADIVKTFHNIAHWALAAAIMTVWHDPNAYFTGSIEGDGDFNMLSKRNGVLELEFMCDPPCRQKPVIALGPWFPELDKPIAEQLSEYASTDRASDKTAAFTFKSAGLVNTLPPALHLALTGTWSTLAIGGTLTITEAAAAATTLYIDCDAQEVYRIVTGTRTPVKYSGDFPTIADDGSLQITGTSFNLSIARLLVIERG